MSAPQGQIIFRCGPKSKNLPNIFSSANGSVGEMHKQTLGCAQLVDLQTA
jgi:hypothetical protein